MANFTIFGANGWIGNALVQRLPAKEHKVHAVTRQNWPDLGQELGNVIFAIGVTVDFRDRPVQTAQAHVAVLLEVLQRYRFESLLYLSSTRVYRGSANTLESAALVVNPSNPDELYNITKLAGESICLSLPDPSVRVARLSNVLGPEDRPRNFLAAVMSEAKVNGNVLIQTSPYSERDYLGLDDAISLLELIALRGRERIYNVASGCNTSHCEVASLVARVLGAEVTFAPDAPVVSFPPIAIDRIRSEFDAAPEGFEKIFRQVADIDDRPNASDGEPG
jgi:nucleoside-diphosphate-sugar epimerase